MENTVARVISYLFHPLFMPLYFLLLLLNMNVFFSLVLPFHFKLILAGLITMTTILLPMLVFFFLYRKKLVRSVFLETREERIYPILVLAIFYYLTYYLLKGVHLSAIFSYYMLGATFLAILALILTFYLKISLHMLGIGGVVGMITGMAINFSMDLTGMILPILVLAGIIGTARLKLNTHKPSEIYSGFLVGVVIMFVLFFVL
jgi:hypothetical protein